jgi:dolichyl-phosphate beta-glucosyltransferase
MTDRARRDIVLSIVIPAFNEAGSIGSSLEKVKEYLQDKAFTSEVIVVDDGSTDGTAAVAEAVLDDWPLSKVLKRSKNLGKGYSVREGVLESSGGAVLFSDADLSTPIEEADAFLSRLGEGYDVVIGTRAHRDSDIQVRQPYVRETMGKAFNLLVRLFFLPGFKDTQCGFKIFRRTTALDVFRRARIRGFAFDVEVLVLCRKLKYSVSQVPVIWRNSPPSRVRMIRSSFAMLKDLLRIRFSGAGKKP